MGTGAPKCAGYATEGSGLFRVGAIAREHRIDRRVWVFGRRGGPQVAGPYGRRRLHPDRLGHSGVCRLRGGGADTGYGTAECAGYAEGRFRQLRNCFEFPSCVPAFLIKPPLLHPSSYEESGHRFGFDQLAGLVEVVVDDCRGVDAEAVVDRGQQLAGVDWIGVRG